MKIFCIKSIILTNGEQTFNLEQGKTYNLNKEYAEDLLKEGHILKFELEVIQ